MKELVDWLASVEEMAAGIYRKASDILSKEDEEFSNFTARLAKEEDWHCRMIKTINEDMSMKKWGEAGIEVDEATKREVETYFKRVEETLTAGNISRELLLESILEAELSEWNDIFLYVVNSFKKQSRDLQHLASHVTRHKRQIVKFAEKFSCGNEILDRLRQAPPVWENRILIIEDEGAIRDILCSILKKIGKVETAINGKEGLEKAKEHYFDLIMSDVDMPVMNGFEFYNEAKKLDKEIAGRMLYFSGALGEEERGFLESNGLKYLLKPSTLKEIRDAAAEILKKPPEQA